MISHRDSLRDFDRARRKAFIQAVLNLIKKKSSDLLPFDEVRAQLRLRNPRYKGLQEVPLDQIVGSVGRYRDSPFCRASLTCENAGRPSRTG